MNGQRDPDAILATWLEDGPVRLPDTTKRAIAVTTRTTRQSRRPMWVPWRFPTMNTASRLALGVVAVAVIALGGFYILNPGGGSVGGQPSPAPSPSPSPSAAAVPTMDTLYTSPMYGYTLRRPSDWTTGPATVLFDPVVNGQDNTAGVHLDAIVTPTQVGLLRAGSVRIPAGQDGEEWTALYITGCNPQCRQAREAIVIDGQPAFINGASDSEVEATVISGDRVYLFTLFRGGDPGEPNVIGDLRGTFDALMATVDLRPEDAVAPPTPGPSQSPTPTPS